MSSRNKLVLINPSRQDGLAGLSASREQKHPSLGLASVAGLTHDDWEIVIEDELWQPATFHTDATLVGVTAFTSEVNRAYELLAEYQKAGIPTIMGGIHAMVCQQEARQYAGSILTQDAESAWKLVLSDCDSRGVLNPEYHGGQSLRFARPRYDLLDSRYEFGVVQFSRGCPQRCIFCSVPVFSGNVIRRRPVWESVLDLHNVPQKKVFVADDNLYGCSDRDHAHARLLMDQIARADLGKKFVIQASLDVTHDDRFLEAAALAGVKLILIGIEASDTATLKSVGKTLNLKNGLPDFTRIHAHGIGVLGAFVFGFDTDTPASLIERARFMVECGSDCNQMTVATPLPGTPLYRSIASQGRLLYTNYPTDWSRYDMTQLVYVPSGFRCEAEFYDSMLPVVEIAYSDAAIKDMARRTNAATNFETMGWAYTANQKYADTAWRLAKFWESHKAEGIHADT